MRRIEDNKKQVFQNFGMPVFLEVTHWIFYAIKIEAGSYHICIDNRKDCDSIVMKGDNSMKNLVMKYKKTIIFLGVYSILFGCLALWPGTTCCGIEIYQKCTDYIFYYRKVHDDGLYNRTGI